MTIDFEILIKAIKNKKKCLTVERKSKYLNKLKSIPLFQFYKDNLTFDRKTFIKLCNLYKTCFNIRCIKRQKF